MLRREYRNGPGGRWTHRIRWYDQGEDSDEVTLAVAEMGPGRQLIASSASSQLFNRRADAEEAWEQFKNEYPIPSTRQGRSRFGR